MYPRTSPQDQATTDLIHRLRNQVIPRARAGSGIGVYIGGLTATNADFAQVLTSKLPLFVALVVLLSFLLLMIVFRSLLIPLVCGRDEPALRRRRPRSDVCGLCVGMGR